MLAGRPNQGDCALSMTDSSTSAGWLHKINFREFTSNDKDLIRSQVPIGTAQHHATLFLKAGIKEYSQWLPGKENNVANALSCDFNRSPCELTKILCKTCPSQLPKHFQIAQLPNEISSWLTALLLKLPVREQLREAHTRTTFGRGTVPPSTLEAPLIGHDAFLDSFTRAQLNKIIGAFAMALREGHFLSAAHDKLVLGTIRNSISDISATLRENG